MDVQINEIVSTVRVTDTTALLDPRIMALIVAEVKRHLMEEEQLRTQRNAERSADVRGSR